jgi:hypothetical protein
MAVLFLAKPDNLDRPTEGSESVVLEDDASYWFLYWYFEAANLSFRQSELIDLYNDSVIEGYQLHLPCSELEEAVADVAAKPERWKVRTGWEKGILDPEHEIWREVDREELTLLIQQLLGLVTKAQLTGLKLVCSGD